MVRNFRTALEDSDNYETFAVGLNAVLDTGCCLRFI